jgi:two-component system, chemotaxis family, chemotaxis protein CheY
MATTILVVDDSLTVRRQVGAVLKAIGYTVLEAADGVDALAQLDAHPTTSMIVCDVHMPNMNGLEFMEQLQLRRSLVPVVVLTTEGQPELIRRAKSLGAKFWFIKPFKAEFLVAAAQKLAVLNA